MSWKFRKVDDLFRPDDAGALHRLASLQDNSIVLLGSRLMNRQAALALLDWLAQATGHYPKEPKP